jgi:hypothetical protein
MHQKTTPWFTWLASILLLTSLNTKAQDRKSPVLVRDESAGIWRGPVWEPNPVRNPKLPYQAGFFPKVSTKGGTLLLPESDAMQLRFQIYIENTAPDQVIMEWFPTATGKAVARIALEGNRLLLEIKPNTDHTWAENSLPIRLATSITRGQWCGREILFLPGEQQQTIGWTALVNNPVASRQLTAQSSMILSPQPTAWKSHHLDLKPLTDAYIGEVVIDFDTTISHRENTNLKAARPNQQK